MVIEVAKGPVGPDAVVPNTEPEFLQALLVIETNFVPITPLRKVFKLRFRFVKEILGWFDQVCLLKVVRK